MTDVILCVSMIRSASTASTSRGDGHRVGRHDVAGGERQHIAGGRVIISRRRSPSVNDARQPSVGRRPRTSCRGACSTSRGSRRACARRGRTRGAASPPCITFSTRISRLPSLPPGCSDAKSSSRNPLRTEQRHRERIAERERGRRARGRHEVHRAGFLGDAAVERHVGRAAPASTPADPVIAIEPARRCGGSPRAAGAISSVSPLCDSAITTSSSRIAPRSPWVASAGWRKKADVPCSRASPRSCGR